MSKKKDDRWFQNFLQITFTVVFVVTLLFMLSLGLSLSKINDLNNRLDSALVNSEQLLGMETRDFREWRTSNQLDISNVFDFYGPLNFIYLHQFVDPMKLIPDDEIGTKVKNFVIPPDPDTTNILRERARQ